MTSLLDDVNALINLGVGDQGRLTHIRKTLQNDNPLFGSDENYIHKLKNIHGISDSGNTTNKTSQNKDYVSSTPEKINIASSVTQKSFCGSCGNNMGSNNFCSKCGQSNVISSPNSFCGNCGNVKNLNGQCHICNNNNSGGKTSKKIGKIILYLFGLIVIISGIIFFAFSMSLPAIFAGQYLMISLFILVVGGILMYVGKRIKSN